MKYAFFLGSLWLILFFSIKAQIYPFRHYGLIEGLPEENVNYITEDHNGFLWLATQGGVCKFDGKHFYKYSTTQGLHNNLVKCVIEDNNYHIWVATRQGVARLIGERFEVFTEKDGLADDDVNFLLEDKNGNIWCATNDGISKFDGKRFTNYNTFHGLIHNKVHSLHFDHRNILWIGTDSGLVSYDGKQFRSYEQKFPLTAIHCIFQDKKLNLWFGTSLGAYKLDHLTGELLFFGEARGVRGEISAGLCDKDGKVWLVSDEGVFVLQDGILVEHLTTNNGLVSNNLNCIWQDTNLNFWFGSDKGVSKISNRRFIIFNEPSLYDKPIRAFAEDANQNIWIGTNEYLLMYDRQTRKVLEKKKLNVRSLLWDKNRKNLWIGSVAEGLWQYDGYQYRNFTIKDGLRDNTIYCLVEDDQNRIWAGTDKGLARIEKDGKITTFSENQGLADNYVRCALNDGKGNLWFGTYKGLSLFRNGIFTNFTTKNGLPNSIVLSMTQDSQGILWLATENGLCQMKPNATAKDTNCFICYTEKDGFASQNLWSVVSDSEGNIWVGHRSGIDKFSPKTHKVRNYSYIDGFALMQTFPNALFNDSYHNLWIGTFQGLVKYIPYEDRPNRNPPILHLIDVRLFNRKTDWHNYAKLLDPDFGIPLSEVSNQIAVELAHDENSLTFEFVGVHFTVPEKVKYQYKLEGFDKDWSEKSSLNTATYTNLPPGTYTFLVRSFNSDDVMNPVPIAFKFKIDVPYWEKWWFYLAQISFFLSLVLISLYLGLTRRNSRYTIILAFTTMLMIFEFINVYIESFVESYTGNIPIYKVIANVVLASLIAPFEKILKTYLAPPKPSVHLPEEPPRFNRVEYEIGNPNEGLV